MPVPGDRVVVRRLLPSGQASDVIGTLLSDGDPLTVRSDRDGTEHVIPRDGIVRWKTVPPRPVRASEIRSLDLARARSWWSVEREWIDGWLCRAAPGLAGNRASSAAPLRPDASAEDLPAVRDWFAARGLPLRLEVSGPRPPVDPGPLEVLTDVLTASPSLGRAATGATVTAAPDARWLAVTGVSERLIRSVDGIARFVSLHDGSDTVAAARVTVTADAAGGLRGGLAAITVAPAFRRRGLARAVVRHAIAEAAELGASRIHLEVTRENGAAQRLYRSLGFVDHHSYGFWTES